MEEFLYKQLPVVVVMGLGIGWLAKLYIEERNYSKKLAEKSVELAQEASKEMIQLKETIVNHLDDIKSILYEKR